MENVCEADSESDRTKSEKRVFCRQLCLRNTLGSLDPEGFCFVRHERIFSESAYTSHNDGTFLWFAQNVKKKKLLLS